METTAKALIDHWAWATKRGLMNANTAGTLRAACAKVLSIFDDLDAVDVRQLDIQETLKRFRNLRGKDLKPDSIEAYEQRFRQALKSFLDYVNDPGAWRSPGGNGHGKTTDAATRPRSSGKATPIHTEGNGAVDYPFPLREGFVAHMVLPADLKSADIQRLSVFMGTLVLDEPPTSA